MIMGDMSEVRRQSSYPSCPVKAGSTEMGKVENDDLITFLVKYENGAIGDFSSSRVATGRKNYFYYEIQGTERLCGLRSGAYVRGSGLLQG